MWPVCLLLFPAFGTPQASHSHAMVTLSALCLLSVPSSISICCVCFQSLISATITITTTTTGDHSQQGWLSYINTIIVETESWERRDHLPLDKWQQIGAASSSAAAMNVQTTIHPSIMSSPFLSSREERCAVFTIMLLLLQSGNLQWWHTLNSHTTQTLKHFTVMTVIPCRDCDEQFGYCSAVVVATTTNYHHRRWLAFACLSLSWWLSRQRKKRKRRTVCAKLSTLNDW